MNRSADVYLGLGSSLDDRLGHLQMALDAIHRPDFGMRVVGVSSVYNSAHMGLVPGDELRYPGHLNAVARLDTTQTPLDLLDVIHEVETQGGRTRAVKWGPRTIDVDILLYGDLTVATDRLRIPHPGIIQRAFVLRPLLDLAPDFVLPDGQRLADLFEQPAIRAQRLELYSHTLHLSG